MNNIAPIFRTQVTTCHPTYVAVSMQAMSDEADPFDMDETANLHFELGDRFLGTCQVESLRQILLAQKACLHPTYVSLFAGELPSGALTGVLGIQMEPPSNGPTWRVPSSIKPPFTKPCTERFPFLFVDRIYVEEELRVRSGNLEEEACEYLETITGLECQSFAHVMVRQLQSFLVAEGSRQLGGGT